MPRVKIGNVYGNYAEIEATEISPAELKKLATEALEDTNRILGGDSPGPAMGFSTDRRWTPDHNDTHYNGSRGFGPVKAEES